MGYGIQSIILFSDKGELKLSPKSITFDDLLVPYEVTEYLGNLFHPANSEPTNNCSVNQTVREIDKLIIRVINVMPTAKSSEIWKVIARDITKETREFDTDEILDEVGEKELCWYNLEGELKPLKKKSFYNLVKKLKIN